MAPYGSALSNWAVRRKLKPETFAWLRRFGAIYNASKHDFGHRAGTHGFSMADAVFGYTIARQLAKELYPLAGLRTSLETK